MGGLTVDVSDMHDGFSRLTLTPAGALYLAKLGIFKEVSDREVRDKSKADVLGKGLVIFQVTWMILQCVSRKVAGYPLAALEVHTLVHACCALIMYILWFRKPLDINESTLVSTEGFKGHVALMLLRSPGLSWKPYRNVHFPTEYKRAQMRDPYYRHWPGRAACEATFLAFCAPCGREDSYDMLYRNLGPIKGAELGDIFRFVDNHNTQERSSLVYPDQAEVDDVDDITYADTGVGPARTEATVEESLPPFSMGPPPGTAIVGTLETGEFMGCGIGPNTFAVGSLKSNLRLWFEGCLHFRLYKKETTVPTPTRSVWYQKFPNERVNYTGHDLRKLSISLSRKDIKRYNLAAAAFMNSEQDHYSHRFMDLSKVYGSNHLLVQRADNFTLTEFGQLWSVDYDDDPIEGLVVFSMFCVLLLLGMFYGGIHLALWTYAFPTTAESLLWKISAVELLAMPVAIVIACVVATIITLINDSREAHKHEKEERKKAATKEVSQRLQVTKADQTTQQLPVPKERNRKLGHRYPTIWFWLTLVPTLVPIIPIAVFALALTLGILGGLLLYLPARIFIIIESFISLRHVPVGVYTNLSWAQYIPHL